MNVQQIALILSKSDSPENLNMVCHIKTLGLVTIVSEIGNILQSAYSDVADVHLYANASDKLSALKAGLEYIQTHYTAPYVVVIVDTEGYHTPNSVKLIADEATLHPDTLILSRQSQKEKKFCDRLACSIKHLLYRRYTGIDVYGETNCLKAFSDELLLYFLDIRDNHYDHDINLLIKCREHDIPVMEIKTKTTKPIGNTHWVDVIHSAYIRHQNIIKFASSSFTAFLIDYGVYSLILAIGTERINFINLTFANIAARVVSSTVNFTINRKFVFKSNQSLQRSAAQFFTLAAVILACNSVVLNFLANVLNINHYIAKIMTEMFFFVFNYTLQNFVIFRKKK